jgi:hypothetical protein
VVGETSSNAADLRACVVLSTQRGGVGLSWGTAARGAGGREQLGSAGLGRAEQGRAAWGARGWWTAGVVGRGRDLVTWRPSRSPPRGDVGPAGVHNDVVGTSAWRIVARRWPCLAVGKRRASVTCAQKTYESLDIKLVGQKKRKKKNSAFAHEDAACVPVSVVFDRGEEEERRGGRGMTQRASRFEFEHVWQHAPQFEPPPGLCPDRVFLAKSSS